MHFDTYFIYTRYRWEILCSVQINLLLSIQLAVVLGVFNMLIHQWTLKLEKRFRLSNLHM